MDTERIHSIDPAYPNADPAASSRKLKYLFNVFNSGGSRISRRGRGLQRGHFLAKMCAKTKELGPVGGRVPSMSPRSANV